MNFFILALLLTDSNKSCTVQRTQTCSLAYSWRTSFWSHFQISIEMLFQWLTSHSLQLNQLYSGLAEAYLPRIACVGFASIELLGWSVWQHQHWDQSQPTPFPH